MLQSQLCNDLGRAGETESTGVERYVIEGRIVNLGVEITPDVPASRMVFLPDKFGRFGFIQVVVLLRLPDAHLNRSTAGAYLARDRDCELRSTGFLWERRLGAPTWGLISPIPAYLPVPNRSIVELKGEIGGAGLALAARLRK